MTGEIMLKYFTKIIFPALLQTIAMVCMSVFIGYSLGLMLAIILYVTHDSGLMPNKVVHNILNFLINTIRSFPGLILIVAIMPLTRIIVGTSVGLVAAVVPLSISCMAFSARLLEESFRCVDKQLIEAAKSFGASNIQIIFRVVMVEAVPSMVAVLTMSSITYLAMSTIAGTVGGGGLGAVALTYGYQSYNNFILYICVLILFILVQIVQFIGKLIQKRL